MGTSLCLRMWMGAEAWPQGVRGLTVATGW
jgi:hypothetical protein